MDVLPIAPPKPELPGPENKSVDVSGTMQAIIAHNTSHLREKLKSNSNAFFRQFADIPLYEHKPLDITDDNTGTTLTSYKHPWEKEKALSSLKTTGCYEVRMLGKTCICMYVARTPTPPGARTGVPCVDAGRQRDM